MIFFPHCICLMNHEAVRQPFQLTFLSLMKCHFCLEKKKEKEISSVLCLLSQGDTHAAAAPSAGCSVPLSHWLGCRRPLLACGWTPPAVRIVTGQRLIRVNNGTESQHCSWCRYSELAAVFFTFKSVLHQASSL